MKRVLSVLSAAAVMAVSMNAYALKDCRLMKYQTQVALEASNPEDCTVAYALDNDVLEVRAGGAWVGLSPTTSSLTGANGATLANGTNNHWILTENSEDMDITFSSNLVTLASSTGATYAFTPAVGFTADATFSGAAGAVTFDAASSSVLLSGSADNQSSGLAIGSTGATTTLVIDSTNSAEGVVVTGYETVSGLLTVQGGAGAVTLSNSAASVLIPNNDSTALNIGASGLTTMMAFDTTTNTQNIVFNSGVGNAAVSVTGAATLDASDCGKPIFVTAAHDGNTITLPALTAVPSGCIYRFFYVGADAGALVDITPNASDGIEGSCTLAASVVTFSGTDDADVGLTKATIQKGDTISLISGDADDWYAFAIHGICANN